MGHSLRTLGVTVLLASVLGSATACGSSSSAGSADGGDKPIEVIAGFYPLRFIAERVGGDQVQVTNLTDPGAEPHDLELSPRQVADIGKAGLLIYLAGLQPELDAAVKSEAGDRAFDVATVEALRPAPPGAEEEEEHAGEEHANEGMDPHVWLDPTRFAAIVDALAGRLAAIDAEHAADFRSRAATLRGDLEALDREYTTGLANCQRRDIVTSHAAFGYLAQRYRLEQIPITGINAEGEAGPQQVTAVAELARQRGATTIFFETLVSPKLAETIANEVGAKTDVLDPIEGLKDGSAEDYLSIMRANLGRLRAALGCV
ncbi:MAG TPA: metal ABC transporter substrate-binding protein [Micromonosporaceae bacterium]|nr:metal ABC transporter substrate-binding protein [Micromonosporaceae bacterium]